MTARISHHLAAAKLQRVLDLLPDWLDRCRVAVNVTKTAALLTGQQRTMPPKLRLRGQEVDWQTRVRYLGVQIDRSMRMAAQVEHVIHQSRAVRSMLQCSDRTYRSEPKSPYTRATSVCGSRTRLQHGRHSAPLRKGRRSKPSRISPYR
ncbi:hypothetical protein EVAR_30948_1 [Eumeta japonica]|uniref:RNA-directed DNA polymerase from mobile element jockey n=1 Tax=Eumeta variegata TaxID=151549 RepID=A0A4C1V3H7_EUMVA|nr:hypothetical protein EVAR_30948_1 [Eumeta japonica]